MASSSSTSSSSPPLTNEKGIVQKLTEFFERVQEILNYDIPVDFIQKNTQFNNNHGIGRAGVNGALVGIGFGVHITLLVVLLLIGSDTPFKKALFVWSEYFALLSIFHFFEFFVTTTSQPSKANSDSFVINHSKSYTIAALVCWIEFWVEFFIFGEYKTSFNKVRWFGIALVLFGQITRSAAMWHCGENFSHLIAHKREKDHVLVTDGIYKYFRHPSYLGWFYWSVGTQLVLCNPISTVGYYAASYMFFKDRIAYEEKLLYKFFKQDYINYMNTSYIGIPFIPVTKLVE